MILLGSNDNSETLNHATDIISDNSGHSVFGSSISH